MKIVAFIACSMDGYIAKENGDLDWLTRIPNPNNSDYGYNAFFDTVDAVLMGKNTFIAVDKMNYWGYSKKVYVWSNTLEKLDIKYEGKAEIISGDIDAILKQIESNGVKCLYVDGGKTIQSFLEKNLIDEITITTISIILGGGIPLFGRLRKDIEFDLIKAERINENMVSNYYVRRNRTTAST